MILVLCLYTFLGTIIASILFFYHFYLMFSLNTTANEIKKTYALYYRKPMDRLSLCINLDYILTKQTNSLINNAQSSKEKPQLDDSSTKPKIVAL